MRVLVTGGAGYVGSHACKALASAGHEPVVFDNLRTGHKWAVKWGPLFHGDILDRPALDRTFQELRPEAVMHFAALAYVGESVSEPHLYYRTNVAGTLNLLDAMRAADVGKIVLSSTCAVYGAVDKNPISETTTPNPINPYGRTKLFAESALSDYCAAFGMAAIALRYFNAAGADPDGEIGEDHDPETHLIPLVAQVAAGTREHVSIFGDDWPTPDGTCIRDYVHVSDLASAHVAALTSMEAGRCQVFNLGAGRGASVRDIITTTERVTGRAIREEIAPRRPGDPAVLIAETNAAMRDMSWTPKHTTLEEIIGTAWNWHCQRR